MPLFNAVKIYGDAVAEVLERGERLIVMGLIHPNLAGDDSAFQAAVAGEKVDDRLVEGIDWTGVQYNQQTVNRMVTGSSGEGAPGSYAELMWRASKDDDSGRLDWAVTDRRLLLLQRTSDEPVGFAIRFALPRRAVRSVRRRARLLLPWGRCEVTFTDASRLTVVVSLVDLAAATGFVRALS